jgi:hypothetical protein
MSDEDPNEADVLATLAPNSKQLNADDLIGRPPVTITIVQARVIKSGDKKQPWSVTFTGLPGVDGTERPWKPCLTVRRILTGAWGLKMKEWRGRQVTIFRDPEVNSPTGQKRVGGIRVSHLSHLPGNRPLQMQLTVTQGVKGAFTVQPIVSQAPAPFYDQLMELVTGGLVTKQQVHTALGQRRAQDVPASEHATILTRLRGVQQTLPDTEPNGDEE